MTGGLRGHRDFRRLWGGETVSELGSQVSLLAMFTKPPERLGFYVSINEAAVYVKIKPVDYEQLTTLNFSQGQFQHTNRSSYINPWL